MGKRELFIIAAFVVIGVAAYQLTAPPATAGASRFSLSSLLTAVRRQARGNRVTASAVQQGTIAVGERLTELRISNVSGLDISGEARKDISYELTVESNGPDEPTARQDAENSVFKKDDAGAVLSLTVATPPGVGQVARLSLHVPARLAVRIEGAPGQTTIVAAGVAAIQLDAVVGDVRLTGIVGAVTGTHRNGDLAITDAAAVTLTLVSSKVVLTGIRGAVTLTARNGQCRITAPAGSVDLDIANEEVAIPNATGPVQVSGTGGTITLDRPHRDVKVDVHRATVDVTLDRPVPLTVLTTDQPLRLWLAGPPPVTVSAVATEGGAIHAPDFALVADRADEESRLTHTFGSGAASIALRNQRAEIVIAKAK